jgi:hypothetical protein
MPGRKRPRRETVAKLIRFPADLETWLVALSESERRSFTAQVIRIIEEWKAGRGKSGADVSPPA